MFQSNSHRLLFMQSFLSLVELLFELFCPSVGCCCCLSSSAVLSEAPVEVFIGDWRVLFTCCSLSLLVKRGIRLFLFVPYLFLTFPKALVEKSPWTLSQGPCVPRCRWHSTGKPSVSFRCIKITIVEKIWFLGGACSSQDTKFVTSLMMTSVLCWTFLWQSQWGQ